jgi:murein DD-endopeptidase MepM/ murein hydrolase activator NlpD
MRQYLILLLVISLSSLVSAEAADPISPLFTLVDLEVGQTADVMLSNGETVRVKLVKVDERRGELRDAVRESVALVELDGEQVAVPSSTYHLPKTIGKVQIDCPVTKGYGGRDIWAMDADARLRLWPAGSPWIRPGTFVYPAQQRWFATDTQMGNVPCYVNACDIPGKTSIYYHYGLDIGGCEKRTKIVAATEGRIVSLKGEKLAGVPEIVKPRYDVLYLRDPRGWYYRYSHLAEFESTLKLGDTVRIGQPIGLLGKEGGSGGWTHLHFGVWCQMPSGRWGSLDGYCFFWQAYHSAHDTQLQAVARPHRLIWAGETTTLDGSRSFSRQGPGHIASYEWTFGDGSTAAGQKVSHRYDQPGAYCEMLKVTDKDGRTSVDFAVVHVCDPELPTEAPISIHASYHPTLNLRAAQEILFKVRAFNFDPNEGQETWDFGDGTPTVITRSDGNQKSLNLNGYAVTSHCYEKAGRYLVTVSRSNRRGETATTRLYVTVEE